MDILSGLHRRNADDAVRRGVVMKDLITRLEAAEEGSRELDAHLHAYKNGWQITGYLQGVAGASDVWLLGGYHLHDDSIPHYTTNLQDALSLVPEGWYWQLGCNADPGEMFVALLRGPEDQKRSEGQYDVGHANNPALALCIAALKAMRHGS